MRVFLVFVAAVAALSGVAAIGLVLSVLYWSTRPGAETFGYEIFVIPLLSVCALFCFGVAWLCYKKRDSPLPRFSLRTMLIVTAIVAVVLGMIAWLDQAWIGK
jgi:hypothetical protein